MNSSDPIDHALAAIASIRDQPDVHRAPEPESVPDEEKPLAAAVAEPPIVQPPVVPSPAIIEPNGYSKAGPGPMAAIRFKWTARRDDNGDYYVDETIGDNVAAITAGPMSGDAAVKLVDDRESEAKRQFDLLKSEMTGFGPATTSTRQDGGEM